MERQFSQDWSEQEKLALIADVVSGAVSVKDACERYAVSVECIREWMQLYRRSVLDAFDERVTNTLVTQGVSTDGLAPAELTGTLADVSLSDLIQTFQMGRKDGVITVTHQDETSRMWCEQGEIIDAESGQLSGRHAVYRILGLEQGRLVAHFRSVPRVRAIQASIQALLLEAAHRNDEIKRLQNQLGDLQTVHSQSETALSPRASIRPDEIAVLRLFNGERSLAQVLACSDLGDLETREVVVCLMARQYLEAGDRISHRVTPPPSSASFASTADVLSGGLDRSFLRQSNPVRARSRTGLAAMAIVGVALVAIVVFRLTYDGNARRDSNALAPSFDRGTALSVPEPHNEPSGLKQSHNKTQPEATPPLKPEAPSQTQPQPLSIVDSSPKKVLSPRSLQPRKSPSRRRRRAKKRSLPPSPPRAVEEPISAPPVRVQAPTPPQPHVQVIEDEAPQIQVLE